MGYRQGWKHATACEYDTMNINCTGGTVIEMKTAWYGRVVPHRKECNGSSQHMSGSCPTNEYNIRLFREACHGKPSCSVNRGYNIPDPCNLLKWTEFWYDCVPGKPSTS
ncbi:hypothetical protein GE061_018477 [Apolygus lucorum]|uniref:SUEL-type lectin domain-containing protein n=1 Tax=Apolygus lucorum TaxID=248454 RepID=A0A8S9XGR2_APOLU|nr:hypothetical protein GE061_018477 [Apolygus lucorum]